MMRENMFGELKTTDLEQRPGGALSFEQGKSQVEAVCTYIWGYIGIWYS